VNHVERRSYSSETNTSNKNAKLDLNINGNVSLNLAGKNVGNITPDDIRNLIDKDENLKRYFVEFVFNGLVRNGMQGKNNLENNYNRRGMPFDINTYGGTL
jgi:hypothetical protein